MQRIRRLYLVLLSALMVLCFVFGLAACNNEHNSPDKLSAPIVTLNQSTGVISWNAVKNADGYEVYEGTTLVSTQTDTTYIITRTEIGTYKYTVKATSTDENYITSNASNEVTYSITAQSTQLAAPQISLNSATGVITWGAVEHASGYEVYEGTTLVSTQTETSYTIAKTQTGTYKYTVKATSTDGNYTTSVASNEVIYLITTQPTQLAAPQISLNSATGVITWGAVEHANGYEVYEGTTLVSTQTETSYTITKTQTGTYKFTVKATSTDSNYTTSAASNEVTYTYTETVVQPTQLSAPTITLVGNLITWDAIENASYYEVYEGDSVVARVAATSYSIAETIVGVYSFSVKAASSNPNYLTSERSNIVEYTVVDSSTVTKLAAPQISLDEERGVITWNAVEHATGYIVMENGMAVSTVTGTSYTITQTVVGTYSYTVRATSTNPAYSASDNSNVKSYTVKATPLEAPYIEISGNILTWKAIENANSYDVYESGRKVATIEQPLPEEQEDGTEAIPDVTYAVSPLAYGKYTYKVVAISKNTQYLSSGYSNEVEYEYSDNKPALASPVITLDQATGLITWTAVENADGYEIYENGRRNGEYTSGLSYQIKRLNPGVYTYAVRATDSEGKFKASEPSKAVSYTVVATEMTFTVGVVIPESYSSKTFTIGLYKGEVEIESKELTVNSFDGEDVVEFTTMSGEYIAKINSSIASGYTATQATLSAENPIGIIRIIQVGSNTLKVGTNGFTVRNADQEGADQSFVFIAEKSGYYTIRTTDTLGMYISLNGLLYIDSGAGMSVSSIKLTAGQVVDVTVVGWAIGNYTFIIEEGEAKQDLVVGTNSDITKNPANFVISGTESCKRYLTLEEDTTFIFFFPTATIGTRIVVITINGVEYEFDGNENYQQLIRIEAGTDIEIEISVYGDDFENRAISFFVVKY